MFDPTDQSNHYAVISPDGTIAGVIVWNGRNHYELPVYDPWRCPEGFPPGSQLVALADVADPELQRPEKRDEDGNVIRAAVWACYVDTGAPAGRCRLPRERDGRTDHGPARKELGPEHDHAPRACCLPTFEEERELRARWTRIEQAVALAEKRSPDSERVAAAVARQCAEIYELRRAELDSSGKAPAPLGPELASAQAAALVPNELVGVLVKARELGADEGEAERELRRVLRA